MRTVEDAEIDRAGESFSSIYDAQHRRLLRVAYLLRGDLAAAEDDVAEAFARTYQPWLDGRVHDVGAYLRSAVVNASRSAWRSRARRARVVQHRPAALTDAADQLVADRELLRAALGRLPKGQREAVVLRYVDDLSETSTAEVLGVSVGTVKSQVARGLAALRAELEGMER